MGHSWGHSSGTPFRWCPPRCVPADGERNCAFEEQARPYDHAAAQALETAAEADQGGRQGEWRKALAAQVRAREEEPAAAAAAPGAGAAAGGRNRNAAGPGRNAVSLRSRKRPSGRLPARSAPSGGCLSSAHAGRSACGYEWVRVPGVGGSRLSAGGDVGAVAAALRAAALLGGGLPAAAGAGRLVGRGGAARV